MLEETLGNALNKPSFRVSDQRLSTLANYLRAFDQEGPAALRSGLIASQVGIARIGFQHLALPFEVTPDALRRGLGELQQFGTARRPHRAKLRQAASTLEVHAVEEQHVAVNVEAIPDFLPSAIRASLRLFEIASRDFVNALPTRWSSVTAPVWTVLREDPVFWISCVAMHR